MDDVTPRAESSLVNFFKEHLESNRQAMEKLGHPPLPRAPKISSPSTEPSTAIPAHQNIIEALNKAVAERHLAEAAPGWLLEELDQLGRAGT